MAIGTVGLCQEHGRIPSTEHDKATSLKAENPSEKHGCIDDQIQGIHTLYSQAFEEIPGLSQD